MRSIQRRLSLGLISVMVIFGLVLAQTSLWLFEMGLQRYLEAGLRNDSEKPAGGAGAWTAGIATG